MFSEKTYIVASTLADAAIVSVGQRPLPLTAVLLGPKDQIATGYAVNQELIASASLNGALRRFGETSRQLVLRGGRQSNRKKTSMIGRTKLQPAKLYERSSA